MNIKFESIVLHNFMSFENAEIKLNDMGFVKIIGINKNIVDNSKSNGSGKSAIWEALNWVFTGETLRGSKDIVRNLCEDGTFVKINFKCDNDCYEIIRSKNHSKLKTNLFIKKNYEDVSGKGIRDTEIILKNILPDLNSELINSIIILGQGLPLRFTNNTPSGRKDVLEKLSKSDFMIDDLKSRVNSRQTFLNDQEKILNEKLIVEQTKQTITNQNLEKEIEKLKKLNKINFNSLIDKKNDYESKLNSISNTINELNNKSLNEKYYEIQTEKLNINNKMFDEISKLNLEYKEKIDSITQKTYDLKFGQISKLTEKIKELDSVSDVCPTCGQKLKNVTKFDTTELKIKLNELNDEYENESKKLNELNDELESKISEIKNNYTLKIKTLDDNLISIKNELNHLNEFIVEQNNVKNLLSNIDLQINSHSNEIKMCEENIKILRNEFDDSKKIYDELFNNHSHVLEQLAIQKKFDTILKRDFRGFLLQNCISYINDKAKEYCKQIFKTDLIEFKLDGNNISISYCNKEYESLSGGEKQKIDLIIQFAIRKMLCTYLNFSCNILVLDELTDNIDSSGCKNIIDFITNSSLDVESVFIISHHENLELPFDNIFTIEKNDKGISNVL